MVEKVSDSLRICTGPVGATRLSLECQGPFICHCNRWQRSHPATPVLRDGCPGIW